MHDSHVTTASPNRPRRKRRGKGLTIAACALAFLALFMSAAAVWRSRDVKPAHHGTAKPAASSGPNLVAVPSEVNKNGMLAAADLAKLNLKFGITPWPSVSTSRNRVISQDPLPGTKVPEGTAVQLKVSTGPV